MSFLRDNSGARSEWRHSCRFHSQLGLERALQLLERHAGAPRLGEELPHQDGGLLRTLPRATARCQLTHERAGAMPNLYESLCLEVAVRLRDGGWIDTQLGGELPDGWQRRGASQCARRDRETHAFGDLDVQRNRTPGIDAVKHRDGSQFQCNGTV